MRLTDTIPQSSPVILSRPRLQHVPARGKLRVAQITPGVRFDAQYFAPEQWERLEVYCPEMLVGSAADLHWLAERMKRGEIVLNSVDHAIFILTAVGDVPVTDTLRVVLWQTFGVPVYELFISADGAVLAGECEAHEGWHIEPGCRFYQTSGEELLADSRHIKGIRTGLAGHIEQEPCVCGRVGLRLMAARLRTGARTRLLLAATA